MVTDVAPTTIENVPAEHPVHEVEDRSTLYLPALQSLQSEVVVLPSCSEYLPASHATQSELRLLPSVAENVPAAQSRHVSADTADTDSEYFPAPHKVHAEAETAPVDAKYLPDPQLVHPPSPTPALYLPSAHPTHVPLTLVYPALHWQDAWPEALSACAGHDKQIPLPESDL